MKERYLLPVALACLASSCASGAPGAEEPTVHHTEAGPEQGEPSVERPMTLEQVLHSRNDELQDCLVEHKQQHPDDESLNAHFIVDHCGHVLGVKTVIGDHAIDECILRILEDAPLAKQETCNDPGVDKTYEILHPVTITR